MAAFQIKGVADSKHVLGKVIIEGYRFEPNTGSVIWAIDKKQTGKAAYRLKMRRRNMETKLVMFSCKDSGLEKIFFGDQAVPHPIIHIVVAYPVKKQAEDVQSCLPGAI